MSFRASEASREISYHQKQRPNKLTNYDMNKILMNAAGSSLGARSYESPEVNVVEVHSEGVLCASGQLEGWQEDELDW